MPETDITNQELGLTEPVENNTNNGIIENETEVTTKTPKKQTSAPKSNIDILAVLKTILQKWDETLLPVLWMSKERLQTLYNDYNALLTNRLTLGASRGAITSELKNLDKEIDENIEYPKNRLIEKLKSKQEAIARFREFGIVKERAYKLPLGRENREMALSMLKNALSTYQFQDMEFGIEYWTNIYNRYSELVRQAREIDGSVSANVGTLTQMRNEVCKFHNSFINIVKGNYPDTWRNELRDFGFQKEKY